MLLSLYICMYACTLFYTVHVHVHMSEGVWLSIKKIKNVLLLNSLRLRVRHGVVGY